MAAMMASVQFVSVAAGKVRFIMALERKRDGGFLEAWKCKNCGAVFVFGAVMV